MKGGGRADTCGQEETPRARRSRASGKTCGCSSSSSSGSGMRQAYAAQPATLQLRPFPESPTGESYGVKSRDSLPNRQRTCFSFFPLWFWRFGAFRSWARPPTLMRPDGRREDEWMTHAEDSKGGFFSFSLFLELSRDERTIWLEGKPNAACRAGVPTTRRRRMQDVKGCGEWGTSHRSGNRVD